MDEVPPLLNKSLTKSKSWSCLAINLFMWPGLGMVLAKKKVGYAQMTLSGLSGAGMILAMIWFFISWFGNSNGKSPGIQSGPALFGGLSLVLFIASWFWTLMTSLQLLREAPES